MSTDQIRIMAYRHSAFYSPLLAAIAGGFLRDEGLQPDYFLKPKERSLYDMFRQGEVDVMQAAVSTSWDPLSKGVHEIPHHFAQINQRDGFFIVGRKTAPAFSWKSLEGAAVLAAQQPLVMLKYAIHLQGVDWNRINAINAGDPDAMVRAFKAGTGEYIHLQGPAPQQLQEEGVGFVLACVGDAMPPLAFSSLMAMPDFLASEKAAAFMRAYRRALKWVNEAPAMDIAACELPMFSGVSVTAMAAAIERYQQLQTWRLDPDISREQYEVSLDAFVHSGLFLQRFPFEAVVSNLA